MNDFSYLMAKASIKGSKGATGLYGNAVFYQKPKGVLAVIAVWGLPKENTTGFFAVHIHEGGSCVEEDFSETGGHYNPSGRLHPEHSGDLPPLLSCDGTAYMQVLTNRFSVKDIIGRSLVIHSGPDDFTSQPAGNPGIKIACGVIS